MSRLDRAHVLAQIVQIGVDVWNTIAERRDETDLDELRGRVEELEKHISVCPHCKSVAKE